MNDAEIKTRVLELKRKLGRDLCILGHYYQREEVVEIADHEGDSYALAKLGAATDAKFIVFCGVHFMAEASVILAKKGQRVFLPNMDAGCPLADMASIDEVSDAWLALENLMIAENFIPVTYMNSSAALKAFCGAKGGLVCTSSSAVSAFKWVLAQGKRIFFFPDENLGRNTAAALGIGAEDVVQWNPRRGGGALDAAALKSARVIVWRGFCHVHTFFTPGHVADARKKYPGCKIVVHPECDPGVVSLSDSSGSTAFLKKYAEEALPGSTIVIGTEINLVARLARHMKDRKILPLARSLCPNMFRTSLRDLLETLDNIGAENEIFVDEKIAKDARAALKRMLKI